jgi:hypothetical protein
MSAACYRVHRRRESFRGYARCLHAIPVAGTLTLAQLVVHNGIAVTFPACVRLSPAGGVGAMEMIGQTMVTLYGGLFALMLALIVPAGAAAAAWFVVGGGSLLAPLAASVVF